MEAQKFLNSNKEPNHCNCIEENKTKKGEI